MEPMKPGSPRGDRWKRDARVEELLLAALQLPAAEQQAFLEEECDDEALRAELIDLLRRESDGMGEGLDRALITRSLM